MNEIDNICRVQFVGTRAIAAGINISVTHTLKYLKHMTDNGHLTIEKDGAKGNTYKSTKTFAMNLNPVIEKPKRGNRDYDSFARLAPHVRPFADTKALPRDFFKCCENTTNL